MSDHFEAFEKAAALPVKDIDFDQLPHFRGVETIPRNQVRLLEKDEKVEITHPMFPSSTITTHGRAGDAVITSPWKEGKFKSTLVPQQEFKDCFEKDPFHQGRYRSRLSVRAAFVKQQFRTRTNTTWSDRYRVSLAGAVQEDHYLVLYTYGVTYNHAQNGGYLKFDYTNTIRDMAADSVESFHRTFARTDATGKTLVPLTLPLDEQLAWVQKRGWKDHERAIQAEIAYHEALKARPNKHSGFNDYAQSFAEALAL